MPTIDVLQKKRRGHGGRKNNLSIPKTFQGIKKKAKTV